MADMSCARDVKFMTISEKVIGSFLRGEREVKVYASVLGKEKR